MSRKYIQKTKNAFNLKPFFVILYTGDFAMKYQNISKNNEIREQSEDKKYSKKDLFEKFKEFISKCGYSITDNNDFKRTPYVVNIKKEDNEYKLIMFYKNITGAGWSDKPNVKRVQVTNVRKGDISKYVSTSSNETFMILGYYNFDDNPIMVAWNAYHYVYHDTTRSCYVDIDTLLDGYKKGYIETIYAKQNIWVFTPDYFDKFLHEYIESNKVD